MASKTPKRESLARYFKDLDDCESDSDECEDEERQENSNADAESNKPIVESNASLGSYRSNRKTQEAPVAGGDNNVSDTTQNSSSAGKLPSALDCLKSQSNPSFLKLSEQKEVNWDQCEKRLNNDDDEIPLDFKSNAVPPPSSYEPVTDPGIKVVDSEGRKRKTFADDLEDQMTSSKAYKVEEEEDT